MSELGEKLDAAACGLGNSCCQRLHDAGAEYAGCEALVIVFNTSAGVAGYASSAELPESLLVLEKVLEKLRRQQQ